jgi:hypothetical protein
MEEQPTVDTEIRAPGADETPQEAPSRQPPPSPATEGGTPEGRPDDEPGPARPSSAPEGPHAPEGRAPSLDDIEPGDGPGQTPGE